MCSSQMPADTKAESPATGKRHRGECMTTELLPTPLSTTSLLVLVCAGQQRAIMKQPLLLKLVQLQVSCTSWRCQD